MSLNLIIVLITIYEKNRQKSNEKDMTHVPKAPTTEEMLKKLDSTKEFYEKMITRQRLRNQFQEIWNKKYGKEKKSEDN